MSTAAVSTVGHEILSSSIIHLLCLHLLHPFFFFPLPFSIFLFSIITLFFLSSPLLSVNYIFPLKNCLCKVVNTDGKDKNKITPLHWAHMWIFLILREGNVTAKQSLSSCFHNNTLNLPNLLAFCCYWVFFKKREKKGKKKKKGCLWSLIAITVKFDLDLQSVFIFKKNLEAIVVIWHYINKVQVICS